jgi:hypothetical protein
MLIVEGAGGGVGGWGWGNGMRDVEVEDSTDGNGDDVVFRGERFELEEDPLIP